LDEDLPRIINSHLCNSSLLAPVRATQLRRVGPANIYPERVLNGFALLHLDGPNVDEVFYDVNGGVAWP
jgi:hypothetical protein